MTAEAPNLEAVPRDLRDLDQWVFYKLRERKNRPGKFDKIPLCLNGTSASTTKRETWGSWKRALKFAHMHDGLGFVFTEDDPFVGIDLDACVDAAGELLPEARELVDMLGSYTEWSPSRKGVH